jgi:hypothetical protein
MGPDRLQVKVTCLDPHLQRYTDPGDTDGELAVLNVRGVDRHSRSGTFVAIV